MGLVNNLDDAAQGLAIVGDVAVPKLLGRASGQLDKLMNGATLLPSLKHTHSVSNGLEKRLCLMHFLLASKTRNHELASRLPSAPSMLTDKKRHIR